MSFDHSVIDKKIKRVLHVGADRGGELPQYQQMGVEEVVWVEANPEVYGELLENLEIMNITDVKSLTYNQLVTDQDDVETDFNLYYGHDAGHLVGNKGMSSLLKARNSWWGSECYRGTIQLNSLSVDTFLKRNEIDNSFDMMNIDTQGAELMVFKGATEVLNKVNMINCEVTFHTPYYHDNPNFDEVYEYLKLFGFKHIHTDYCLERNWGDALFIKKD